MTDKNMKPSPDRVTLPNLNCVLHVVPWEFGQPLTQEQVDRCNETSVLFAMVPTRLESGGHGVPPGVDMEMVGFHRLSAMPPVVRQIVTRPGVLESILELCLGTTSDVIGVLKKHGLEARSRQVVLEWLYPDGGFPTQWSHQSAEMKL